MTAALDAKATVITVGIFKGGVGKTSLISNMGGLLAKLGYAVLIVVTDPQDNEGEDLGYTFRGQSDSGRSLATALLGQAQLEPLRDVRSGLDVVTAGDHLAPLCQVGGTMLEPTALENALLPIADDYDFILIDTPPSQHGPMEMQALTASRWLLVPTQVDESSKKGIAGLAKNVLEARQHNPDLGLLGVVMFDVPRSAKRIDSATREDLQHRLGGVGQVYESAIRTSKAVARDCREHGLLAHELADFRSQNWRSMIGKGKTQVADASGVAEDYLGVAKEMLHHIVTAQAPAEAAQEG